MNEKCPDCKVKLVEQWQKRGRVKVLMLVCPECGFEKFPLPTWPRTVLKI